MTKIEGIVEIQHGNLNHICRNKIVLDGKKTVLNIISTLYKMWGGSFTGGYNNWWAITHGFAVPLKGSKILYGLDKTTKTVVDTTIGLFDEVTPTKPAALTFTKSDYHISGSDHSAISINFTVEPDVFANGIQIGELGLMLNNYTEINFRSTAPTSNVSPYKNSLFSRLSVADGEMPIINYDAYYPLTVIWTIRFTF